MSDEAPMKFIRVYDSTVSEVRRRLKGAPGITSIKKCLNVQGRVLVTISIQGTNRSKENEEIRSRLKGLRIQ
jgi:hypothetical protein